MKAKLFVIFFSIFFSFTNAQDQNIDFINLKYELSSVKNCSDVDIMIIYKGESNPADVKIEYCKRFKKKKKSKAYSITSLEYKTLVNQFYKIINSDVFNYSSSCFDGNCVELNAGSLRNSVSYNLSCLNKQKINTPL